MLHTPSIDVKGKIIADAPTDGASDIVNHFCHENLAGVLWEPSATALVFRAKGAKVGRPIVSTDLMIAQNDQ